MRLGGERLGLRGRICCGVRLIVEERDEWTGKVKVRGTTAQRAQYCHNEDPSLCRLSFLGGGVLRV